jgi:hypothetical protein
MSLIHNNNFQWFLVKDNFLTQDECNAEMNYIDEKVKKDEFAWGSLHNCKNVHTENKQLLDKIWKLCKISNTLVFNFDIDSIQHSCIKLYPIENFKDINSRLGAGTLFHSDYAAGEGKVVNTCTKLSCVIFLNDDFEGGGLQIWGDKIDAKKGRAIIFPSFAAHRVLEFDKKDRYTMITFIQGNTFK